VHQLSDRIPEAAAVQRVQLRQTVAQAPSPYCLPLRALLPVVEPARAREYGERQGDDEDPPVGEQPVDQHHHEPDAGRGRHGEGEQLGAALLLPAGGAPVASPDGRSPAGHRYDRIGYDTVGRGRGARSAGAPSNWTGHCTVLCGRRVFPSPAQMLLLPMPTTAKATTAKIIASRLAPGAHHECPRTGVPPECAYGRTQGMQASPSSQLPPRRDVLTAPTDKASAHQHIR